MPFSGLTSPGGSPLGIGCPVALIMPGCWGGACFGDAVSECDANWFFHELGMLVESCGDPRWFAIQSPNWGVGGAGLSDLNGLRKILSFHPATRCHIDGSGAGGGVKLGTLPYPFHCIAPLAPNALNWGGGGP